MTESIVLEILDRAMADPAFRALLRSAPEEALAGYDLTAEEREAFRGKVLKATELEERVSTTDLTALTSAKTGSPITKAPSQLRKR